MKKIRVGNGYITNIELSCGKIAKIDVDIEKQPVSFTGKDAEQVKETLEQHYKDKNKNIVVEITIEDM